MQVSNSKVFHLNKYAREKYKLYLQTSSNNLIYKVKIIL